MNTSLKCKICDEVDVTKFRQKNIRGKIYYEKTCKSCEAKKALEYYHLHKEEKANYQKEYLAKNKDKVKNKKKKYDKNRYLKLKTHINLQTKIYSRKNRDKINKNKKIKRKIDPAYRLRHYISARIRKILNKNGHVKNTSCLKYLDYSFHELKNHIEKQFESWMTWDNHGIYNPEKWNDVDRDTWTWNLDHIIPQSDLLYTSMMDDNFKKCWALENLRPLSSKMNILDGTSRVRHGK